VVDEVISLAGLLSASAGLVQQAYQGSGVARQQGKWSNKKLGASTGTKAAHVAHSPTDPLQLVRCRVLWKQAIPCLASNSFNLVFRLAYIPVV
jgi:hypothetical protein